MQSNVGRPLGISNDVVARLVTDAKRLIALHPSARGNSILYGSFAGGRRDILTCGARTDRILKEKSFESCPAARYSGCKRLGLHD